MKINTTHLLLGLLLCISGTSAFDCQKKELEGLHFDTLKGLHHISVVQETLPSVSNLTWFINVCGAFSDDDRKNYEQELKDCPKDSQICGVKYVSLPGSEPLKTEVIAFSDSLNPELIVEDKYKVSDHETTRLQVKLQGATWGPNTISANVSLICDKDANDDRANDEKNIKVALWDNLHLEIEWKTSSLCSKGNGKPSDNKKDDGKKDDHKKSSSGFGIFSLLFNLLCVVISIYILGVAYLWVTRRDSGASIMDHVGEVTEALKDIGRTAPGFLREVAEKVFGAGSRGGYSAV